MKGLTIIVAADLAGGIGKDGGLPWRLPGDMARFKNLTTGRGRSAVVMGRRTFASIPQRFRPLARRLNIVLSRGGGALGLPEGVVTAGTLDEAFFAAEDCDAAWIIGGGQVYAQALAHPRVVAVDLTRVWGRFDCDTFFGPLPRDFHLTRLSDVQTDADVPYVYERYERR